MNALHCLVWVSLGRGGRRLAHLSSFPDAGVALCSTWIDNARRWTDLVAISALKALPDDVDLMDPVVQRALRGATSGRPYCTHKHHFIPQVKTATRGQAALA